MQDAARIVPPSPVIGESSSIKLWLTGIVEIMRAYNVTDIVASSYLACCMALEPEWGLFDRLDANKVRWFKKDGRIVDLAGRPFSFVSDFLGVSK